MKRSRPWDEFKAELMQNAQFARVYEELESEYQIARQVMASQLKRGFTQEEPAEYVGTNDSRRVF